MNGEIIIFAGMAVLATAIVLTPLAVWKGKKEKRKLEEYIKKWY